MRIAVAAHSSRRAGGVEQYLATVVPALARAGHDVSCWFETADGSREPILEAGSPVVTWTAAAHDDSAVAALRAWRPDVVYAHGMASVAREQVLLDVAPAVLFAHSYYGTCISGTRVVQVPTEQCCTRRFGASCLLQYYPRRCGGWSPVTMARLYRRQRHRLELLESYSRILVASRHMAGEYARHVPASKVSVVPLPIEARVPHAEDRRDRAEWQLLYLGRMEPSKGTDIALESAARVAATVSRPVHLQVSGAGSWRGTLERRGAELMRLQPRFRVTFTDWLGDAAVAAALDESDLLLVPSRSAWWASRPPREACRRSPLPWAVSPSGSRTG